ncbi:hypothetical protein HJC23_009164 [Cyclotella cryptica]|uniref:O-fucosyltransferase family protein n=1 Tax=Cyclotella cryptica TaxID=29204 RepID=A0ABD3PKY2_9STRA|eukprot:CCRYP_013765-RA/>CCRYP_013765-RA protein AED:0.12 eAED:0.12 QI:249/1/1/1/1/1/5/1937/1243
MMKKQAASPRSPRSSLPQGDRAVPMVFRVLTTVLPLLAVLLLISTLYLFHLHHAHHDPEDDTSDVKHAMGENQSGPNSVGGSALRHKMDLANFLLEKYDRVNQEMGKSEAQRAGWKGGDEQNFIRLVKEMSDPQKHGGAVIDGHVEGAGHGHTINSQIAGNNGTSTSLSKRANASHGMKVQTKLDLPPTSWKQLQQELLDTNLLPKPIPRSRTARGHSGLPRNETPALVGAQRGQINCPDTHPRVQEVMSSMLAFWNENRGERDEAAVYPNTHLYNATHPHPFLPKPLPPFNISAPLASRIRRKRYLTFEPDTGGWNNLRMSFENILLYAAISGRTVVLPPDQNIYLMEPKKGEKRQGRNYFDIFNLTEHTELLRRVPIITAKQFLELEGGDDGLVPLNIYNETFRKTLWAITEECEDRKKSDVFCDHLYTHYLNHGQLADISAEPPHQDCVVLDTDVFMNGPEYIDKLSPIIQSRIKQFCGDRRKVYYNRTMHDAPLWHFETLDLRYRMLVHFYSQTIITDPVIDNFYKRFIRDYLRYHNEVMCAAGKIILALQYEGYARDSTVGASMDLDSELVGGYSSLHIRRGDLQYKEVKFSAAEWYENTEEIWKPNEVLYIATDENYRPWFDDFKKKHAGELRYLSDYKELTDLDNIDITVYGLIDTLVASRGTMFAGTWFSTFSGYIIRLRGYFGMSKFSNYYSWDERKYFMHNWMNVWEGSLYAREYPTSWTSIDGDEYVTNDREGTNDPFKERAGLAMTEDDSAPKNDKPVARGVSGRPIEETKAVIGARRAHITCDVDVDDLAYWNEPQGRRDYIFETPYRETSPGQKPKYLAFSMDGGGFNNIRMSLEIVFVLAAAMGRTLILPPDQPMYLLRHDAANRRRGLAGFFDMEGKSFKERVKFITMEEFLKKEATPGGQFVTLPEEYEELSKLSREGCDLMKVSCGRIHDYLTKHGTTPNITATHHQCFVVDDSMFHNGVPGKPESAKQFCSSGHREMVYLTRQMQEPQLLYIQAGKPATRMLAHFYGYIHFTDPSYDNYFRRYVRDLLHYRHEIFCAAGKIVKALQSLGEQHGFRADSEGIGGYSSFHIRRGDFQYRKMKLSADEWYNNTKDVLMKNEFLYIATDEKDKSFFLPFQQAGHYIFFLDNFEQFLGGIDPNHRGMIETVIASRGRAFVGTYRSTFSGYINRLRGYYGISMNNSWYGDLEHKTIMHEWSNVNLDTYAKEWPDAWIGIDSDVKPAKDKF